MGKTQINNRDWIFAIKTGASTWAEFAELTEFDLNPGENDEEADTTTFENDGEYSEEIMQRGATLGLTGMYSRDPDTGARDPGQAAADLLCTQTGAASVGTIRMRHESEEEWTIWDATCRPDSRGGETNEKTGWEVEFTRCYAARTEAVTP
jgi:hypothetical protein